TCTVQRTDRLIDGGVACGIVAVQRVVRRAGFEREGALARSRREFVHGKSLMNVFRTPQAIEPGAGEDESVSFARFPFAQTRVDVAAHLHKTNVGTQCQQHRFAARAGRTNARMQRQRVQSPKIFADERIASVGARTARSMRPAASASSISLMKMPLALSGEPSANVAGATNAGSCMRSPMVRITSISTEWPCARSSAAMWLACQSAS